MPVCAMMCSDPAKALEASHHCTGYTPSREPGASPTILKRVYALPAPARGGLHPCGTKSSSPLAIAIHHARRNRRHCFLCCSWNKILCTRQTAVKISVTQDSPKHCDLNLHDEGH